MNEPPQMERLAKMAFRADYEQGELKAATKSR